MNISDIKRELLAEYSKRRIHADFVAQKNITLANSKPIFKKIIALEKELIFKIGKDKADNKNTKNDEKTLKTLRDQKKKYLASLNLSENDLVPHYQCKECRDNGFIGTIMCDCFAKELNERVIEKSGFNYDKDISFSNFDSNVAKNEKQKEYLDKLKEKLLAWCEKFNSTKKHNLVFVGQTGVGKTFSAKCITSYLGEKGLSICCVSAFQMNDLMLKYHTTFDNSKSKILLPLINSDVLFVDDLGTEPKINNVTENYLYLLLSERDRFKRSTIITTNLSPANILNQYGERIYSRMFAKDKSIVINFKGDDLRTK